jgi:hypothetical protein
MTGGLIQLVSKGLIDNFITDIPEITFFKYVFHRYSNFAIEIYEDTFSGSSSFGSLAECRINPYGDLISNLILHIELPSLNEHNSLTDICIKEICDCYCTKCNRSIDKTVFSWANGIGHLIIDYVELQIGGKTMDRQSGEWLNIWTDLTLTSEKRQGYNEMIGKKEPTNFNYNSYTGSMSLFVPLNFWFCRDIGYALPLVSIFYEDVKVRVKWRNFHDCYISNIHNAKRNPIHNFNCSLLVDHIFLDIVEREKFIKENQTYVIDQIQHMEMSFAKAVKCPKIDISSFFGSVRELIWAVQRSDIGFKEEDMLGNDWYNYSINKNRLINIKTNINETFASAKFILNGIERFREMKSTYFRLVQPYQYHTKIPNNYIYLYSFSIKPEQLQPSGMCNFSVYSNITLQLNGIQMPVDYVVKLWIINHNILLISDGIAGLAEFYQ